MAESPQPYDRRVSKEQAGVGLGLHKRPGGLFVTKLIEGGAAHKSEIEILPGDILVSVDGIQVGSDLEKAKALIRGAAGSKVSLELSRGTRKLQVVLRRGSTMPGGSPSITPQGKAGRIGSDGTPGGRGRSRPMRRSNADIPSMLKKSEGLGLPDGGVYEESDAVQMAEDCVTLLLEQERVSAEYGSAVEMLPFRKPTHPLGRWAKREVAQLQAKMQDLIRRRQAGEAVQDGEMRALLREANDKISFGVQQLLYCLEAEEVDEETKIHLWVVVEEHFFIGEMGGLVSSYFAIDAAQRDATLSALYNTMANTTPEDMIKGRNASDTRGDVSEARRRYSGAIQVARELEVCGPCPVARLLVLERCCRKVSAVLQRLSRSDAPFLDDFLPSLMFVLIQAGVSGICAMQHHMTAAMASLSPSASLSYTLQSLTALLRKATDDDSGLLGGWDRVLVSMDAPNPLERSLSDTADAQARLYHHKLAVPSSPCDPGATISPASPPSISLNVSTPLPPFKSQAQRLRESEQGTAGSPPAGDASGRGVADGDGREESGWRDDVWYEYDDEGSGLKYYYNPTTEQTEWDIPDRAEIRRASAAMRVHAQAEESQRQLSPSSQVEARARFAQHVAVVPPGDHHLSSPPLPLPPSSSSSSSQPIQRPADQPQLSVSSDVSSPPPMRASDESLVDVTLSSARTPDGEEGSGVAWDGDKAALQGALMEMIKAAKESTILTKMIKDELKRERRRAEGQDDMIRSLLREKKALRSLLKRSDEEVGRKEAALDKATRELKKRMVVSSLSMSDSLARGTSPSNKSMTSPSNRSVAESLASTNELSGNSELRSALTDSYSIESFHTPEKVVAQVEPQRSQPVVSLHQDVGRSRDNSRAERRSMQALPSAENKSEPSRPTGVGLTFQEDYSYQPSPTKIHGLQATNTQKRPAWRVRSIKTGYEKMIAGKVQVGDVLCSINGESCFGLSRYDLGCKAVGPEGSRCEVVVIRPRAAGSGDDQQEDKITITLIRRRPGVQIVDRERAATPPDPPVVRIGGTEC